VSIEKLRMAYNKILETLENAIDKMKTSIDPVPVILVGGGGIIVSKKDYSRFKGVSKVLRPEYFQFANAIGAAIAQVGGETDRVFDLDKMSRNDAINSAIQTASEEAIAAGADSKTLEVVDLEEIPLSYLPGNAIRIRCKVVGKLGF
jgi:hypothetical protein